jgi:ATP phosphoribosyltransferase regulatory subunit
MPATSDILFEKDAPSGDAAAAAASRVAPLVALLEAAGYPRAETALLQPADVFLDLSGEDIRRRLYLTQDAAGTELCLRPEFTIPLCLAEVAAAAGGATIRAAVSYCGPVFRHRQGERGEFVQAGVESLGRTDAAAADAEILALAIDSAKLLGLAAPQMRLGDAGLVNGALDALEVSPGFARRLKRRLAAGRPVVEALGQANGGAGLDRYAGVMSALEGQDGAAARAFVGDMLAISGARASGGRSAEEIAERFLRKAREGAGGIDERRAAILEQFLSIAGHPDQVSAEIRRLARQHGLDLGPALDRYESRIGFMAAGGIDLAAITASAGFVRNLDYYTGMVFEIAPEAPASPKPLVGGGRYDALLKRLGAAEDVPAVGFAIWVERFGRLAGAAS